MKRWADEGLLGCVKTVGKHRRFRAEELERFRRERLGDAPSAIDLDGWLVDLCEGRREEVMARLFKERSGCRSWAAVCDSLGAVITQIGLAWESGAISVAQEHVASQRLALDLARVAETIPLADAAPTAVLLTPEREHHTLGLSLVSLTLRERGWRSVWVGASTPLDGLGLLVDARRAQLVAVSASVHAEAVRLAADATTLASICRRRGVDLVLGGRGPWPEQPPYGVRLTRLGELAGWLSPGRARHG